MYIHVSVTTPQEVCTCVYSGVCVYIYKHICICAYMTHTHTHTCTCTRMHTHAPTHLCALAHTHSLNPQTLNNTLDSQYRYIKDCQ